MGHTRGLFGFLHFSCSSSKKNVVTCTICTDLVTILDENLTNNATIGEIESVLDAACDILVGMEQDCKDFVAANLEVVIDLLVNEYASPDVICGSLMLCP